MFKKIMATVLCVALAFTAVGCKKKETPEKLVRELTTKLTQAQYLDTNVNATVELVDGTANIQQIAVASNVKLDLTNELPKIGFDGTVEFENMMSIPVKLYMDENNAAFTILNQSQQVPVPDNLKQQVKNAKNVGNINDTLGKHVEETEYNSMYALKVNYDLQQVNSMWSTAMAGSANANLNITKMNVLYVLSENKDNIEVIFIDAETTENGKATKINVEISINSVDQPLQITPPATNETTPTQIPA